MNTIEGIWHSYYEYGQGPNDEPQTSEHQIQFARVEDEWVGMSLPSEDGSEVRLNLRQENDQFRGEWHERTSPSGHYGGREFGGVVLFLMNSDSQELSGAWLGISSSTHRVKHGTWTLRREMKQ